MAVTYAAAAAASLAALALGTPAAALMPPSMTAAATTTTRTTTAQTVLVDVDVIYHSPLPVLSNANAAGQGKSPDDCLVFNPAFIPANPPGMNSSGLLVRMCCGASCAGHGFSDKSSAFNERSSSSSSFVSSSSSSSARHHHGTNAPRESAERIGFAPCDLETASCEDVLTDFNLDPSVDAEDPRAFLYDGEFYNFYYRGGVLPGTTCSGSQCTVALAKTATPLDASSWKPVATLDWHRNGCCVMRPRGERSYCMWGEGPGPFPGLGISFTEDIDSGNFTQVPWQSSPGADNTSNPVTADGMWMLPLGAEQSEVKLEAGTHMVELSSGNLLTFYAAATPGWVPNGNYTVGWLLLDGDDPSRVLQRSQEHVLIPTYDYETLCSGASGCKYEGERKNVIFACSATLLPSSSSYSEGTTVGSKSVASSPQQPSQNATVDHIRLFFGGGDGNVGTAVIRVQESSSPAPSPPPPPVPSQVPTLRLNDGRDMPRLAVSLPKDAEGAIESVRVAVASGITHFVTANDYLNEAEVGAALRASGLSRDQYFLTTMTSPCQCDQAMPHCDRNITDLENCTATTRSEVLGGLEKLGVDFVDLVLLHGPNLAATHVGACSEDVCQFNRAQWKAFADLRAEGKVGSIGVSNYCPSCLDCLLAPSSDGSPVPVPVVNQVQYHVGYSAANYTAFVKNFAQHGVALWAYEPLASGVLASNAECASVGAAHNKSAAQVAMRWIAQNDIAQTALLTHSNSTTYLQQDVEVFGSDWNLSEEDIATLNNVTCTTNPEVCERYASRMTWGCTA